MPFKATSMSQKTGVHVAEHLDHQAPLHVDHDSCPPAHIEFQALLDVEEPNNTDGLDMFDELPESADGFDDTNQEAIEDVVEVTCKKKARLGNYSVKEDEALVLAWENVSLDPVTGKDQPGASYWQRIVDYYHTNVNETRTIGSLNHRWTLITECCSRWAGCVKNIERLQPSGMTMQDRLNATQELYKQREPHCRSFVMFHCWTLLEHNEKWINRHMETNPPKKACFILIRRYLATVCLSCRRTVATVPFDALL